MVTVTGLGQIPSLDPRFVIVMTSCLQGKNVADHRQECLLKAFWRTLTMEVCVHSVSDPIGTLTLYLPFLVRKSLLT